VEASAGDGAHEASPESTPTETAAADSEEGRTPADGTAAAATVASDVEAGMGENPEVGAMLTTPATAGDRVVEAGTVSTTD
jgi:hypothetical protein